MHAYVGCRTTKERNARGEGLKIYRVDEPGEWTEVEIVRGLVNPSFLAFDRTGEFLYTVHGDHSEVSAFQIDPSNAQLRLLNTQSTGGRNPVHLAPDATNAFMVVANFATGTVALLPRNEDGTLGPLCDLCTLPGAPGPHRSEQKGSHPHQILFDPTSLRFLVPDKGVDRVFVVCIDASRRVLTLDNIATVVSRQGAAPRHGIFHPSAPYLYVANELDSTVTTYSYDADNGRLRPVEIVSTLPRDCVVTSHAAGIQITPDGRFVFVSNRGHDSVTTLAVDEGRFTLTPVAHAGSGGKKPRFITLDPSGRYLYVANEDSDTIVAFRASDEGVLTIWGRPVRTGSPVCILFSRKEAGR